MEKTNKKLAIVSVLIAIIVTSVGVAFGYFIWNSTSDTNISFTVEGAIVELSDGKDITGANLMPVASYTTGGDNVIQKDIKVKLKSEVKDTVTVDFKLKINSIDSGLNNSSFKYNLVNASGTSVKSGTFETSKAGDTISLLTLSTEDNSLTTSESNYTFYVYIDGASGDNPSSMQNQSFDFSFDVTGTNSSMERITNNAAKFVQNLDDGSTGDSGSGVYKVHHDAISAENSATGEEIPATDDYRYYGPNPNNFILLPDMDAIDGKLCTYDGHEVDSRSDCTTIYKQDMGDGNYVYLDEYIENKFPSTVQYGTWDSDNNKCVDNSGWDVETTNTYNGAVTKEVCEKMLLVNGNSRFYVGRILNKVGNGEYKSTQTGLYRIIGSIYDEYEKGYRLKIVKAIPLTDGTTSLWGYNPGNWGPATNGTYSDNLTEGNGLKVLLNSGAWWNKNVSTFHDYKNETDFSIDFSDFGISSSAKKIINRSRFYFGGEPYTPVSNIYNMERGMTSIVSYWDGYIGLMYPSDYIMTVGGNCYNGSNISGCDHKNWIASSMSKYYRDSEFYHEHLITPYNGNLYTVFDIVYNSYGTSVYMDMTSTGSDYASLIRPTLYLSKDVSIVSGDGTISNPYQVSK